MKKYLLIGLIIILIVLSGCIQGGDKRTLSIKRINKTVQFNRTAYLNELKNDESLRECKKNDDCIAINDGCCNCTSGGRVISINKDYYDYWQSKLKGLCEGIGCVEKMSEHWTCFAEVKCTEDICVFEHPSEKFDPNIPPPNGKIIATVIQVIDFPENPPGAFVELKVEEVNHFCQECVINYLKKGFGFEIVAGQELIFYLKYRVLDPTAPWQSIGKGDKIEAEFAGVREAPALIKGTDLDYIWYIKGYEVLEESVSKYECGSDEDCDDDDIYTFDRCSLREPGEGTYCENILIPEDGCKELISNFNNPNENRINLVFIGINFPDIISFIDSTNKCVNEDENLYGQLFYYEPFKSNKNKFNLWYVNEIGNVEDFEEGVSHYGYEASSEIRRLSVYCNFKNKVHTSLINWKFKSSADGYGDMSEKIIRLSELMAFSGQTFVHEFGHAFGSLGDEYAGDTVNQNPPELIQNCDIATIDTACSKWCSGPPIPIEEINNYVCSGTDRYSCMSNEKPCFWIDPNDPIREFNGCVNRMEMCRSITEKEFCNNAKNSYWSGSACIWMDSNDYASYGYFKSNCIPSSIGNINLGTNCLEGTGCYQTCGHSNWFKSSFRSMMRSSGFPFNFISQKLLCQTIKDITESAGGICTSILN